MSGLPPGWELDYDADSSRWFYRYKPSGLTQYQFPREGDEFPDFVDHAAPAPTLAPEERLESQQQIRRKIVVDGLSGDNASHARTSAGRKPDPMAAAGGPVSMIWDDDDADSMFYQPENFMYLGPGAYNDVSPVAEEEEPDASRSDGKPNTKDRPSSMTGKLPAAAAAATDLGPESSTTSQPVSSISTPQPSIATPARPPVEQAESQTEPLANPTIPPVEATVFSVEIPAAPTPPEPTPPQVPTPVMITQEVQAAAHTSIAQAEQANSPDVPMLDNTERPHELPETTRFDPVGVVAEMATEDTARAHIELHPDPVEISDNTVLAPIETFRMMDVGIAELPANSSPKERQRAEPPPPRRRNDKPIQRVYPFQPREDDDPNRPPTPLGPATRSYSPSPQPSTVGLQDQQRSYTPLAPSPASTPTVTPPASVSANQGGYPHQDVAQSGSHGQMTTAAPQFMVTRKPTNAGNAPSKFKAWAPGVGVLAQVNDPGARHGGYTPTQRADDDIATTGSHTPSVLVPPAVPPKTPIEAPSQHLVDQRPPIQRSFTQPPTAPEPQAPLVPPPVPRKEYHTIPATLAPARPPITGQMQSFLRLKTHEEDGQQGPPPSQVPAVMAPGLGTEPRLGIQPARTMPVQGPDTAAQYTAFNPHQGTTGPGGPLNRPAHTNYGPGQPPSAHDPRLQQRPHANSLPGANQPIVFGQEQPRHGSQPFPQQWNGVLPAALQPGVQPDTTMDTKGKGKAPADTNPYAFAHRSVSQPAQGINQAHPPMAPANQQAPAAQYPRAANPPPARPTSMYSLGAVQPTNAHVPANQQRSPLQQSPLAGPQQQINATQAPSASTIPAAAQILPAGNIPPSLRTDSTSPPAPPSGRSIPGYPLASPSPLDIRRETPSALQGPSSTPGANYTPSPLTVGSSPGATPHAQSHGQGRATPTNGLEGVSETRSKRVSSIPQQAVQQRDSYFPPQPDIKPQGQAQLPDTAERRRSSPPSQMMNVQSSGDGKLPVRESQPVVTIGHAVPQQSGVRLQSMVQRSQSLSAGKPPIRHGIGQPFAHDSPTQLQHHQPPESQQQVGGFSRSQEQPMAQGMLPQGTLLGHPLQPITEYSEYEGTTRSNSLASRSSSRRHSLPPGQLRQGIQRQPSIAEQPPGNAPSPPRTMPPQQHPQQHPHPQQHHPGSGLHAQPSVAAPVPMPMTMPTAPPGPPGQANFAMRSASGGPVTHPPGQPPAGQGPAKGKSKWYSKFMKPSKTLQKPQAPQWTPPPPQWPQPPGHFVHPGQGRGHAHASGQAQNNMAQSPMHPQQQGQGRGYSPAGGQAQNGMAQPPMHPQPQGMTPGMVYGVPQAHPSGHPLTKLIHQQQHAAPGQVMAQQRRPLPAQAGNHSGSPPPGVIVASHNQNGSPNAKPLATAPTQATGQATGQATPAQAPYEAQVTPPQAAPPKPQSPISSHPPALTDGSQARPATQEKPQTTESTPVQAPQSQVPHSNVEGTDSDDVASILTMDVSTMDVSEAQMIQRVLKPQLIQVTRPNSGQDQKQAPSLDAENGNPGDDGPSMDQASPPRATGPGQAPPVVHIRTPSDLPGHVPPPPAASQLQGSDSLRVAPLFARKPLLGGEVSPPLSGRESMVSDISLAGSTNSPRMSTVSAVGSEAGQRASGFRSKMAMRPAVDYSGGDWGQ